MKYDVENLTDNEKVTLLDNLWDNGHDLWDNVKKQYEKSHQIWENNPDWLEEVPRRRSKARTNRTFLAIEGVINILTGRASQPNVLNAVETDEAPELANDLQEVFLEKYRQLKIKEKMRRALRFLFLSRFMCLKIIWDNDKDDFDVLVRDSRLIRVSKSATSMSDTDYAIEHVTNVSLKKLLGKFPEKKEDILKDVGYVDKDVLVKPIDVDYYEAWVDDYVIYKFRDKILGVEKHPYWDWEGVKLTTVEMLKAKKKGITGAGKTALESQETRAASKKKYQNYSYNYFPRPIPPYIFGTILNVENRPVGETSLIEQVIPLQEDGDKQKRNIADNTEMMNGQWKIDTALVKITKAEAQQAKTDPRGIWFGDGVSKGVEVVFPTTKMDQTIMNNMAHSYEEIDNIFGTIGLNQPNTAISKNETAAGRALIREQSMNRLDELINLMDSLHLDLYSWMYQMMKVRYTEKHFERVTTGPASAKIVELERNKIDGMQIRIIPGQIIQQDRVFKYQRAQEEIKEGVIDLVTYFKETERENPEKLAKEVEMYHISPLLVLNFTQEEMAKIMPILTLMRERVDIRPTIAFKDMPQDAQADLLSKIGVKMQVPTQTPPPENSLSIAFKDLPPEAQQLVLAKLGFGQPQATGAPEGGEPDLSGNPAEMSAKIKQTVASPEFQQFPPEKQKAMIQVFKQKLSGVSQQ